ncbi:uncharacterized protein LOC103989686 isoform X1 [Musa acuminata AAA Group]|uniref:uncharacterized protein LOC103989686 isoform X1 n=1 Tax=Musa acuminata AAA Group TaxID=214697 RepID=UPI0031D9CBB7
MDKRLLSTKYIGRYGRVAAETIRRAKVAKPALKSLAPGNVESAAAAASSRGTGRGMDEGERLESRVPLRDVVADCTRRWFQDALKEARAGDAAMQVLVGQMYHNGYGIPKNEQKAHAWITKASNYRSSVWKVTMPVTQILRRRRLTLNHDQRNLNLKKEF